MDNPYDIPDSTDWLNTPLRDLSSLENALHCQICKEFYDTPMITSCAHTFCSKCIRTSLSTDGRCPACRAADQANKLRNNWALQEIVATFIAARPAALKVARAEQEPAAHARKPGKRKRATVDSDDVAQTHDDRRTTRSKSRRLVASQTSEPEAIVVDDTDDEDYQEAEREQAPDDGLVECPLECGKRMKVSEVEPHLDRCEDERKQPQRPSSHTPIPLITTSRPQDNTRPQDRISELNYSLLKEAALSKKLKEAGIPSWGAKSLLIKRHTEWVNLWNANCDSSRPRSKRELLLDLDAWERTQGGRAPQTNGSGGASVMRKDFDGGGWAEKNRSEFERLVEEARRKKKGQVVEEKKEEPVRAEEAAGEAAGDGGAHADNNGNGSLADTVLSGSPALPHATDRSSARATTSPTSPEALPVQTTTPPRPVAHLQPAPPTQSEPTHANAPTKGPADVLPDSPESLQHSHHFNRTQPRNGVPHEDQNNGGQDPHQSAHFQASPMRKLPMFALSTSVVESGSGNEGGGKG